MGEIWTVVPQYNTNSDFVDSDFNLIENKSINTSNLPNLYLGEENSIAITFIMDRYQNGIDFASTSKKLYIAYSVNDVELISSVVNVYTSDANRIKFSWIPNEYVSRFLGEVAFSVKFKGVNTDNTDSVWSTGNATLEVLDVINPYILDNEGTLNSYTLTSTGWVDNGNEYTYTISINGVTNKNDVVISPACTGEAYLALRDADIYFVECGTNYVKLYASGYKPNINTAIKIVIQ